MKGIVFTELFTMVEDKFGYKTVQAVIQKAALPNGGVYVAGGYYPHEELVRIVVALSAETGAPVPTLLEVYGRHLFSLLIKSYPQFAEGKKTPIEFMASIDNYIHVEVRKLYPDAELPKFTTESTTEDEIVLLYESRRRMEHFGIGLMLGCADYYNQAIDVKYTEVSDNPNAVRFVVKLLKGQQPQKDTEPSKTIQKTAEKPASGFWGFIKKLFS